MGAATTKVLIVDDEPRTCSVISHRLAARGFGGRATSDAQGAKALPAGRQFDVVIADIAMPVVSGLELPIAKSLTEMLGGTLTVVSAEGQGGTFTLRPPLTFPAGAATDVATAARETITLARLSRRPARPGSGEEALCLAVDAKPILILMDIHLPGMDGLEAARVYGVPSERGVARCRRYS